MPEGKAGGLSAGEIDLPKGSPLDQTQTAAGGGTHLSTSPGRTKGEEGGVG